MPAICSATGERTTPFDRIVAVGGYKMRVYTRASLEHLGRTDDGNSLRSSTPGLSPVRRPATALAELRSVILHSVTPNIDAPSVAAADQSPSIATHEFVRQCRELGSSAAVKRALRPSTPSMKLRPRTAASLRTTNAVREPTHRATDEAVAERRSAALRAVLADLGDEDLMLPSEQAPTTTAAPSPGHSLRFEPSGRLSPEDTERTRPPEQVDSDPQQRTSLVSLVRRRNAELLARLTRSADAHAAEANPFLRSRPPPSTAEPAHNEALRAVERAEAFCALGLVQDRIRCSRTVQATTSGAASFTAATRRHLEERQAAAAQRGEKVARLRRVPSSEVERACARLPTHHRVHIGPDDFQYCEQLRPAANVAR